jgi:hydrophobic/amphiphilic exporter-1 (mainly G- bacteria), HAE1 family
MFVDFFIRRPVFSTVCALIIVLAGAVAIPTLPVAQYPALAPPQVTVTANYTGASAQVVESAVTTPLEQAINGVEGMKYISSTSSNNGASTIIVTFDVNRDIDLAAVDIQNRVSSAQGRLPNEVKTTGVTVTKNSSNFVLGAAFYSEHGEYSDLFISNYIDLYVKDALKRVKGVGDVIVFGERKYAMRLWLDPVRLAGRGLTASDVVNALRDQNVQIAAGSVGKPPAPAGQNYEISVRAIGRLSEPRQFQNLIVKAAPDGTLVRLKDVGAAELGAEDYSTLLRFNGRVGSGVGVLQLPNANALDVDRVVRAELVRLSQRFPPGLKYNVAFDTTTFVGDSIREVLITLLEAILLVILVIFLFLESWRATLIPAITIPVSLIGTFAFIKVFGFSINTLTLFGITLATGLVVDDAIVVIENIERHIEEYGERARVAASAAMGEVAGAVIATSLVLIAVFVPVALFPGTTGRLYRQFALTIAFSIAISAFNALTLSPSLAALILDREKRERGRFFTRVNRVIHDATARYKTVLGRFIGHRRTAVALFAIGLAITYFLWRRVPTGFVPDEDQGYFITIVQGPEGTSLDYTTRICIQAEKEIRKIPDVVNIFSVPGFGFDGVGPNRALLFSTLKPIDERKRKSQSAEAIIGRLRGPLLSIPGAVVVPVGPPSIQGIGRFGGFQYELLDQGGNSLAALGGASQRLIGEGNRDARLQGLFTTFTANDPQIVVDIDRDKAESLGVPITQIADALQVYMGSAYINDFDYNNRAYRVYVQAEKQFRSEPKDIRQFYVRSNRGAMVPLDNLVRLDRTTAPQIISHYNLFRSITINGSPAPGYSSGQAIAEMDAISKKSLPQGMSYEWTGLSLEQLQSGGQSLLIFGLGGLFVFLVLSAQYESFALPFIIMLAVPLAILGALLGQWLRGLQNDAFCQVGLVMLIGLASKNAILIVEFAEQLRQKGLTIVEAAIEAARVRLRPILMTSFAFILGVLPLVLATGAGAASRHSLGTAVFGGMFVSTLLNLFFIPILYVVVETLRERGGRNIAVGAPGGQPSPEGGGTHA